MVGGRSVFRFPRFAEKNNDNKNHHENADGRDAKHILDTHMVLDPGSRVRASSATNVHQRVVDGKPERAYVLFRGSRRGPHDGRLYQCYAKSRKY